MERVGEVPPCLTTSKNLKSTKSRNEIQLNKPTALKTTMMSEKPFYNKKGKENKKKQQQGKRMSGYVKFFNSNKGYGFIIPDSQDFEVFVHHTAIKSGGGFRSLAEGEYVEFDVVEVSIQPTYRALKACRLLMYRDIREKT